MDLIKQINSPSKYFSLPEDILKNAEYTDEEKLKMLKNWKNSIVQEQKSESEGMVTHKKSVEIKDLDTAIEVINKRKESK